MSNTNPPISGPASATRRATGAWPEIGRAGKGSWSAKRKASVVVELLRGADLESTSRKYGVTAATLSEWRDAFLAGGAEALKIRQEDLVDEQGRRMKSVIAELAMENELLRERIRRMEDFKLFCGGGRASEPRPVGLHRANLRAPLGCSRRGACCGRPSTSGAGGPSACGRLPAAVRRRDTAMKNSWPRSGAPSTSRPSTAKATARCGPGWGWATCAPRCGARCG